MNRDKWLAERSRVPGIGASDAAALYGLHLYASAFSLFEKMVNPKPPTAEEEEEMRDEQEYGLAIEEPLAQWYARKTDRKVTKPKSPGVFRLAEKPFVFCSPDRFVQKTGVLQLKSGIHFNPSEPLPDHWEIQVQHELIVTGRAFASFAIWGTFRKRYYVNDIPANPEFQAIHIETIERFMHAVHCGVWSKWGGGGLDGSAATSEALRRLYKRDNGATVRLGDDAIQWMDVLIKAKKDGTDAEEREALAKNNLIALMGQATFAELPNGRKLSLRKQTRAEHLVKEAEFRVLRIMK